MTDIELVIKIPNETYQDVVKNGFIYDEDGEVISHAIINGTPLPKGHGKLKDENEIIDCIRNRVESLRNDTQFIKYRKDIDVLGTIPHIRNEVKTIIEADKAERSEE